VAPSEAADLTLDATLLVCALDARSAEARLEQIVRPKRDEAVSLDAPSASEDLRDDLREIVEAQDLEDPAEELECQHQPFEQRRLVVAGVGDVQRRAGERAPQRDHAHGLASPREIDVGLIEVGLSGARDFVVLGDVGRDRKPQLALAGPDVAAHGRLRDFGGTLFGAPLPDAPGGVALLSRCGLVLLEDLVDEGLDLGRQLGRAPRRTLALRRERRGERLAHHPPVDAALARDLAL
jgi:hypothetical protein